MAWHRTGAYRDLMAEVGTELLPGHGWIDLVDVDRGVLRAAVGGGRDRGGGT